MLKLILLLTPIYVTLFWFLLLHFTPGSSSHAKRFLGKFMLACFFIYLGHFLYFNEFTSVLRIFDPFYQLASLLVYPLFYIYFRLLMLEHRFSWKQHGAYLIAPLLIFVLYAISFYSLPLEEINVWMYEKGVHSQSFAIQILNFLHFSIRFVYIIQVVLTLTGNIVLIHNFRIKAIQFYSDFWEIRSIKVVALNILMVVCGLTSVILSALGRAYFISEIFGLFSASIIFSVSLFVIGWLGILQKVINPNLIESSLNTNEQTDEISLGNKQIILDKINILFDTDKIYLNSKLTIQDISQKVGTNRTYISSVINQSYGVNFCTFVNTHRIKELERLLIAHPEMTNQALAEACGFGSIDSLKRAVHGKTGLCVTDWKSALKSEIMENTW